MPTSGWTQCLSPIVREIVCIDPADLRIEVPTNVTYHKMKSQEYPPYLRKQLQLTEEEQLPQSFDLITSDINETPQIVLDYLDPIMPLVKPNGYLVGSSSAFPLRPLTPNTLSYPKGYDIKVPKTKARQPSGQGRRVQGGLSCQISGMGDDTYSVAASKLQRTDDRCCEEKLRKAAYILCVVFQALDFYSQDLIPKLTGTKRQYTNKTTFPA